jgi:sulfide dehydrogenase [flavocytochrome c] flavoprotein subunit
MSVLTRRHVLGLISGLTLACMRTRRAWTQTPSRVGGGRGFGGATCAKYLRRADPSLEVTLVEPTASL